MPQRDMMPSVPSPFPPTKTTADHHWVDALAEFMERVVPDAITTSIILLVSLFGLSLALGSSTDRDHRRVLSRPLDAAAVHDADDADPGAEPHRRRRRPLSRTRSSSLSRLPTDHGAGDRARPSSRRFVAYLNWGLSIALVAAHRDPFRARGEEKGMRDRFPVPDVDACRRRRDLAVRPLGQRAAADGDAGQLPGAAGRRHAAPHDHLVAGGDACS